MLDKFLITNGLLLVNYLLGHPMRITKPSLIKLNIVFFNKLCISLNKFTFTGFTKIYNMFLNNSLHHELHKYVSS